MKLLCLVVGLSVVSSVQAADDQHIRVNDPKSVSCRILRRLGNPVRFLVRSGWNTDLAYVTVSEDEATLLYSKCWAAIYQAKQDGKAIFVNYVTGSVVPDDGFFARSK